VQSLRMKSSIVVVTTLVVLSATTLLASASTTVVPVAATSTGFDISYPQCAYALPSSPGFGIVGVNDGKTFTVNPCIPRELAWANFAANPVAAFYVNTQNPGPSGTAGWPTNQTTPDVCSGANSVACSYDYGWNAARESFANAVSAESADGSTSPTSAATASPWWLDVETGNAWETIRFSRSIANGTYDLAMIQGEVASLQNIGVKSVGIYSTSLQWGVITGGSGTSLATIPAWIPGFGSLAAAEAGCNSASFLGGRVAMIQYGSGSYDGDYVCGLLSTPTTTSVSAAGSATFSNQLVTTNNDGTVSYLQTAGTPDLLVSATGLVTTSGQLPVGTYVATGTTSDTSGNTGTFSVTLTVGTLLQSSQTTASVKASGSAAFTNQVAVTGGQGTETFVQTSGTPELVVSPTGLITTSGTLGVGTYVAKGTVTDTLGDSGTFTFSLSVGTLVQRVPTADSVVTTLSSTFKDQLNVGANLGAVSYVQTSGSASLLVSSSGLVTTTGALAQGTYRASGTTSDPTGDMGKFTFTLSVTAPPPPKPAAPTATTVKGYVVAGKTVTLVIDGSGFTGRPRVTSHPGTVALVTRDTGKVLDVRVKSAAHSRNGTFTFTITVADGESCKVRYIQR
jgi:major membrane immunogen (membrane-anchored lipoprotein)